MASTAQPRLEVKCFTSSGRTLAKVEIVPVKNKDGNASLFTVSQEVAREFCEEPQQLCERGRYEYILTAESELHPASELALRPSAAVKPSGLARGEDRGLIEPGDACGLLPLEVIRRNAPDGEVVARGRLEVRPVKLASPDEYREHYRGMLSQIADKCAGLLLDCRAATRLRLSALWQENPRILEQQLEFLRHTLESEAFRGVVDEVLRNPHRRLEDEREERDISRPFKPGRDFARQVAVAARRVKVPDTHPLHSVIPSLPARISVPTRRDFLDTAENRFAKMVLVEFRDFLADVAAHLVRQLAENEKPETQRFMNEVTRLRAMLETQLSRGFFPDVSPLTVLPLGSPVLQRKAGYRELLRFWLQFHAGAQLEWKSGAEIFEAGARNVATLYEYWLFFQLEELFRQRFKCDQPLHAVVVDKSKAPPQLVLKRGVELKTPVSGVWSQTAGRDLRAEFHFNRKFTPRSARDKAGSWTRGVQPDYTISIWPARYLKEEAEQNELMVHVHFDAKYRVERVSELLGDTADDDAFNKETEQKEEARTAAKYADLLKMHAYRDAVRRTAGAYVLYPGKPGDGQKYVGFHEVLPGLGAFAIRPDKNGRAEGMYALADFLDRVIEHLANRTTARERVSYHVSESYTPQELKEQPVPYGSLVLPELDVFGEAYRALPPAEHHVVVAWYDSPEQLEWTKAKGIANVRLGNRKGTWRVPPEISSARHLLLRTHKGVVAPGLWRLKKAGYKVFTDTDLLKAEYPETTGGEIYAVFEVEEDQAWKFQDWNGAKIMDVIEAYESSVRYRLVSNLGRTSPYPRVLPLRELLKARL
jgi:predicted component of viral defense system (DUF524 family)